MSKQATPRREADNEAKAVLRTIRDSEQTPTMPGFMAAMGRR